jgi:hypothetical protein
VRTLALPHPAPSRPLPSSPHLARAGLGKRILWIGATLLALEIFYVVAGNLFLRFGLLPLVNMAPETVEMGYDTAFTWLPGVARVHNYRIRSQDRNIQWTMEVEDADLTVDLPALLQKTFRATRVRATGVAFRLRQKLDTAGAAEPRARALPPLQGFEDPPLLPVGPAEAPLTDDNYNLWTVSLDDVDATAREIWVDETRLVGPTRARGGFFLKPMRLIQIGPTTVDIAGGEIWLGEYAAAKPIDAHIEAIVGAIDINGPFEDAVRAISLRAQLEAHTPGIELVRLYLGEASALRVEDGSGSLRGDVRIEHGRLMPKTQVAFESPRLVLAGPRVAVTFDYRAETRVVAASPEPLATGDVWIGKATITRAGAEGASPRIEKAHAHFIGLPRDLVGPYTIERTDLDVPATIPDLRWILAPRVAGKIRPVELAGSAAMHVRASLDHAMRGGGNVEASSQSVEIKTPSLQMRARLSTKGRFHGADPATLSLTLDPGFVLAEDVTITHERRTYAGGTLRVDVTKGRVLGGVPRDVALDLAAKLPDLGWLAWKGPGADDPSLAAVAGDVSAQLSIPRPASLFDGTPDEAAVTGSIRMSGSGDARFKDAGLRGKLEASARIERLDLGRGVVNLRGLEVVTRDLSLEHGKKRTPGWWGHFSVPRLDVDANGKDTLFLHVDARGKDGAPFLAILEGGGSIPGWTSSLFPMHELSGSGDLRLSRGKLDLGLFVHASSANITARLHDIGDAMGGAVQVKTKLVSLGFEFTKGESHLKVFSGQEWLDAHIAEINAKAEADRAAPEAPAPPEAPQ